MRSHSLALLPPSPSSSAPRPPQPDAGAASRTARPRPVVASPVWKAVDDVVAEAEQRRTFPHPAPPRSPGGAAPQRSGGWGGVGWGERGVGDDAREGRGCRRRFGRGRGRGRRGRRRASRGRGRRGIFERTAELIGISDVKCRNLKAIHITTETR
ncbi:hypothetical protein GQ55_3G265900 [Panicum hallii var. hallii]|uniref:Uncharacterized protein n=1 Tax=Panicum hallii var. hallii TaxID=1504633 RepID=A0A2T7EDM1_9POAL|nr:hypothetical protein GQ55_3G265900 [Panicum hallii var. hallii]